MAADFIPRPDGSRARQFAEGWLVEDLDGHWFIESSGLPAFEVPAKRVAEATFSLAGLVSALVWQEHRRRTLPDDVDEVASVALARALGGAVVREVAA